jgi:hypothetical protein
MTNALGRECSSTEQTATCGHMQEAALTNALIGAASDVKDHRPLTK